MGTNTIGTNTMEPNLRTTMGTNTIGTNTLVGRSLPDLVPDDSNCHALTDCGSCAGAAYTDSTGLPASCYWCGAQNECISTFEWEADATCSIIGFTASDCPAQKDQCQDMESC